MLNNALHLNSNLTLPGNTLTTKYARFLDALKVYRLQKFFYQPLKTSLIKMLT